MFPENTVPATLTMLRGDPRDGGAERIPTKAGIACRVALLPELITALQQAEAEARERGLLS